MGQRLIILALKLNGMTRLHFPFIPDMVAWVVPNRNFGIQAVFIVEDHQYD